MAMFLYRNKSNMEEKMWKIIITLLILSVANLQAADHKIYSQKQLDQMLAPIALYPDSLLSQILMATTFNSQLKEAIDYSKAHPHEKGDEAVKKVQEKGWDASVASLVAFPDVLSMLGAKPAWAKELGKAFLEEPDTVMDTVQVLREKAKEHGTLKSSSKQKVRESTDHGNTYITVEPASTQTVYVPIYNPVYAYGPWWYPGYMPFYYYPPYYGFAAGLTYGFAFGVGIACTNALWGGFGWGYHGVHINVNRYNRINIHNRINARGGRANWFRHNQRVRGGNRLNVQRNDARRALDKRGLNPSRERRSLRGREGQHIRHDLHRGNYRSSFDGNAFRGVRDADRSRLAAQRGSFSRDFNRGGLDRGLRGGGNFGGFHGGGFGGGFGGFHGGGFGGFHGGGFGGFHGGFRR